MAQLADMRLPAAARAVVSDPSSRRLRAHPALTKRLAGEHLDHTRGWIRSFRRLLTLEWPFVSPWPTLLPAGRRRLEPPYATDSDDFDRGPLSCRHAREAARGFLVSRAEVRRDRGAAPRRARDDTAWPPGREVPRARDRGDGPRTAAADGARDRQLQARQRASVSFATPMEATRAPRTSCATGPSFRAGSWIGTSG
jgi:hypothetical protein